MVTATLTSKGQITIPKEVRDSLHLQVGDKVAFILRNQDEALLKRMNRSVDQVFGSLSHPRQAAKSVAEMNRAITTRMKGAHR